MSCSGLVVQLSLRAKNVECTERTSCVQQGYYDEYWVPGGFQAVPGDELRHVPGCRQLIGGRPTTYEMR